MNFSGPSSMPNSQAEQTIRQLAAECGILPKRGYIDDWVDQASALSGQDGEPADEVEQLLVNLLRKEFIEPDEALDLHASYMNSKLGFR